MAHVLENQHAATAHTASDGGHATEGDCPPPLSWQEVLAEVSQQSEPWKWERDGAVISGRAFGSGKPLLFLNGVMGDWQLLALTMWLLRDDFRTIVVETTAKSARRLSAEAIADDLLAVCDHFQLQTTDLFATSFAGLSALTAMQQQPGRFDRAVLYAGFARFPMSFTERMLLTVGKFWPGSLHGVPMFDRVQIHNHRRWFPPFDETRWEFLFRNIGGTKTSLLCSRLSALKNIDLRQTLSAIQTPVLLLHGEGEPQAVRDRLAELEAGLPNAETKRLSHCGHFPFVTHPHILSRALKEYLLPVVEAETLAASVQHSS